MIATDNHDKSENPAKPFYPPRPGQTLPHAWFSAGAMKLPNMRRALCGRRSTDEHQAASLEVQTQEGERCILAQGGLVQCEHVYLDDAISRAEFQKRPGLIALLNAAKDKQFDAVIVRDESRLGGDTLRSGLVIQDLLESGIRLFYFYEEKEVTVDGAVDKFMIAA